MKMGSCAQTVKRCAAAFGNYLQTPHGRATNSIIKCVTVIQPRCNKAVGYCLKKLP